VNNNFERFSENGCNDQCLKPCEEMFFTSFEAENNFGYYEDKYIIYINNIYMTFIYFLSLIGGLLGLWNNVSAYDLKLIIIKICAKIFELKIIKNSGNYLFSAKKNPSKNVVTL
jgi:hypothetical protein